jgi:hypothetical protein
VTASRYYTSTALPTILSAALSASGSPEVPSLPGTWPASFPFPVLIDWGLPSQEAILVTSAPTGSGPLTLPCTRGVDGTTAQSHAAGAVVVHGTTSYEPTLLQTVVGGGGGTVVSVTAGDASITVGGTSSAPTVETGSLDEIASLHPTAANWSNNSKKITALTAGAASGEAVAFQQLPSSSNLLPISAGGTGSGTQNFVDLSSSQSIAGVKTFATEVVVPTPVNTGDAVTKAYADAIASGLSARASVNEATTAPLSPSYTWSSTGGGTLTATATGVLTVDGQAVALGDRVLVQNETGSPNAAYNGIYLCTTAGAGGGSPAAYVLTRSTDMNTASQFPGAVTFVEHGTDNEGSGFVCITPATPTLNTTPITWTQNSATGNVTAGSGLTQSGATISLTSPVPISLGGTGTETGAPANEVFAGPNGSTGAPAFRPLVSGDIPSSIAASTSGTAAGLSSTLAIGSGGTNAMTAAGALASLGAQGPVVNILTYGASTGSSDNGPAINSAIAALPSGHGTVLIPPGTWDYTTQINLNGAVNVRLAGTVTASGATNTSLMYTGTGSAAAISATGSQAVVFESLFLEYSNTGFTGYLIDYHGTGSDTALGIISRCYVGSSGIGAYAAALVCLNHANSMKLVDSYFAGGVVGIVGMTSASSYANKVTIDNCYFINNNTHIQNAAQAWMISNNTFEACTGGAPGVYNQTYSGCNNLSIVNNWMGDITATSGSQITWFGTGLVMEGNYVGGNTGVAGVTVSVSNCDGIQITGNAFADTTGIAFGSTTGHTGVTIVSNYFGIANPVTGTIPAGAIIDVPGQGTGYGMAPNASGVFQFAANALQVGGSAPALTANSLSDLGSVPAARTNLGLTPAAWLAGGTMTGALSLGGTNLISNPDFATATTGWNTSSSYNTNTPVSLTRLTTASADLSGTCGQVVTSSSGSQQGIWAQVTGLAASTTYTAIAYVKMTSGSQEISLALRDTTNSLSGTTANTANPCPATWTELTTTITTGATGSVTVQVALLDNAAAACTFDVSAVYFGTVSALSLPLPIAQGGTGAGSTAQNDVFAGPTSGSGAPAFRALVAGDVPTLNQSTTGNAATATAANGLKTATTTVAISSATAPTTGQVLTATGASAADWQNVTATTLSGVTVSGTPSAAQVLTATSSTAADWQTPPAAIVAAATGTAGTDETNIAAAVTAAGTGGSVYFPQGTYSAASLSPLSGQTWYGPAVIERPSGSTASVIAATGVTGWTMRDLTIDGGGVFYFYTATSASPCVFTAPGSAYSNGTTVQLTGSVPTGLTAGTTYYVVGASTDTFKLATTSGGTAINSSSTGIGSVSVNFSTSNAAVSLTDCTWCRLEGATVQNTPGPNAGIQLRGTTRCTVSNCQLSNVGYGILVGLVYGDGGSPNFYTCYGNIISGCTIDTTVNDAIFLTENLGSLTGGGQTVSDLVAGNIVTGCIVRNFGDCGIEIGSGSVYCEVSGCTFVGTSNANGNDGILFRDASHCSATGCTVSNLTGSGTAGVLMFNLNSTNSHNSINNVDVYNCGYGYFVAGSTEPGVTLGTAAADIAINGGVIEGTALSGIWLTNVSGFSVTGTQVYAAGNQGIQVGEYATGSSGCTDGTITGCRVFNSSQNASGNVGIILFDSTAGITISGCRIGDNQGTPTQAYGVDIYDNSVTDVFIADCDLRGNATGAISNSATVGNGIVVRNCAGTVDYPGAEQGGLVTNSTASGSVTLNLAAGSVFALTLTGAVTLAFTGATTGIACSFTLYLTENATGGYGVTWPSGITWTGGSAPTLNTAALALNVLVFETVNGGTNWTGSAVTGAPSLPLTVLNGGTGLSAGGVAGTLLTGQGTSSAAAWQGLFSQTAVVTSSASPYSASQGQLVPCDTSGGNITVNLPSAPFAGAMAGIKQVAQSGSNTVTWQCSGTDVINRNYGQTAVTSGTLTLLSQGVLVQYSAAGPGWAFTGNSSTANLTITAGPAFAVGAVVYLTGGSLPSGLSANTKYYVVASTSTTFQVSSTYGGGAITPTGSGSGQAQTCGTWLVISDDLPLGQLEALFAPLASPALTGTPTAPTASALTNSTQIATTAYTDSAAALKLAKASNLSDVGSATTAAANLGLAAGLFGAGPSIGGLGLAMLSIDPRICATSVNYAAQDAYFVLVTCAVTKTITKLGAYIKTAGATTGTGINEMALYATSLGAPLATTGDMTSAFETAGPQYAEGTISGGYAVTAGTNYYIALLANFTGTVMVGYGSQATVAVPSLNSNVLGATITGQASWPSPGSLSSLNNATYCMYAR